MIGSGDLGRETGPGRPGKEDLRFMARIRYGTTHRGRKLDR